MSMKVYVAQEPNSECYQVTPKFRIVRERRFYNDATPKSNMFRGSLIKVFVSTVYVFMFLLGASKLSQYLKKRQDCKTDMRFAKP